MSAAAPGLYKGTVNHCMMFTNVENKMGHGKVLDGTLGEASTEKYDLR
jgi:hypothetical protein